MTIEKESRKSFKKEELKGFICGLLKSTGVSKQHSEIIFSSLLFAEQKGIPSHGFIRVPYYIKRLEQGGVNPRPDIKVITEKKAVAVIDGDGAMGQVSGTLGMKKAIGLAGEYNTGAVSVIKGSHCGALSYYSLMAAEEDCIGLAISNTSAMMAPTGGKQPLLGNNPVSIAAPSAGKFPVILDMALSVAALGKFVVAEQEGKQIPPGLAIDCEGKPTTDPKEALAGTVLPFGGYKGYGLALLADVLCGILSGRSFGLQVGSILKGDNSKPTDNSFFFAALKISAFCPLPEFKERIAQYTELIKHSPLATGNEEIFIPGEKEYRYYIENKDKPIVIAPKLYDELNALAQKFKLKPL